MSTPSINASTSLLARLLADILIPSSPPLRSLSIRLNDRDLPIPAAWVESMVNTFGGTIRRLNLGDCLVSNVSIRNICEKCVSLETLEVPVSVDGTVGPYFLPDETFYSSTENSQRLLTLALQASSSLHTLIDLTDPHATHDPKVVLTRGEIRYMMMRAKSLRKIVCDGRIWTVCTFERWCVISISIAVRLSPGPGRYLAFTWREQGVAFPSLVFASRFRLNRDTTCHFCVLLWSLAALYLTDRRQATRHLFLVVSFSDNVI